MDINTNDIPDRLAEAARNCKTLEELLEFAKLEGFELSDDMFEGIAGGESPIPSLAQGTCRLG